MLRQVAFVLVAALALGFAQQYRALAQGQGESGPFPKAGLFTVHAADQTGPAGTADDPAIWVHSTNPSLSVVIGTNKNTSGGLHVFSLDGTQLQFVQGGKHNNVDVRYGFMLGGQAVDLVSVCDRNNDQIDIYTINPTTRLLTQVGTIQAGIEVYGYAMYHSRATGRFYGFVASSDGVEQWEFVDQGNGTVGGIRRRTFPAGNLIEGIVADDELGYLYLAEEDHGIYKYYAEPDQPITRLATVDVVGSSTQLVVDVEGLTIYYRRNGLGYLIASSQGNDRFTVYRREGNNAYLGTFEVDAANNTDGIDVINMSLGALYPSGMFIAQNTDRDFQMVRWEDIANALGLAIDTQGYDVRGGGCTDVQSIDVSPTTATVAEGMTVQLTATPKDASGTAIPGCVVTWSSDDPTIATVASTGLVTGLANGFAMITATAAGVTGTAVTIEVTDEAPTANFSFAPAAPFVGQQVAFTDMTTSLDVIQSWLWDFGDNTTPSALQNPAHSYTVPGTYTVSLTVVDDDGDATTVSKSITVTDQPPVVLYFALASSATLSGVTFQNEDIIAFDGTNFRLYFDGSDVGLSSFALDAFAIISPREILMSFTSAGTIPGIAGTVDDSDIVKFTAASLGENTAGTFSLYFDGSDVGLTTSDEDVDAIALLSDGRLLISTTGSFSVPEVSGTDKDLLAFTPTSLGATTAGTWALYFRGSNVGLTTSSENIDAVAVDASGKIYLSTTGSFSVPGLSGANEDVFVFTPTLLGSTTAGTFGPGLFFDGSLYGLGSNDIKAISLPPP